MPLAPQGFAYTGTVVEAYFDNLLPDSVDIRTRIKQRFAARSLAPFDLLEEIGRDCVGAVQLIPDGEDPSDVHQIEGKVLGEAQVEAILGGVTTSVRGRSEREDAFRISIAGAQEKTALLKRRGRWYEPLGATPNDAHPEAPLGANRDHGRRYESVLGE